MLLGQEKEFCLDQIPLFPSCKSKNINRDKKCFQKRIEQHIKRAFNYPEFALKNKIRGEVQVYGTILKSGYFEVNRLDAPIFH
jgi:protein TonB